MTTRAEVEKNLRLISKAWGTKQSGFVFFPYIDRQAQLDTGNRRAGFHEGPAFKWPQERQKIIEYCLTHTKHDLYWSTSIFEYPIRREDYAMDEHALWADLDAVDPSTLDDYPPTVAWESSPGRYQALWLSANGDFQGASWPGNENQRLTYLIGADPSGWDTVQLLRMPGWENHKPEYGKNGKYPKGKMLWSNGPRYQPGDFDELPEVSGVSGVITDAVDAEIDGIDRQKVIVRVRIKLTKRARDMLTAKEYSGDRSGQLWYLIRALADVGCSVAEIVSIVQDTVWNKFKDRGDERRRLILEASKAIAQRSDEVTAKLEEEDEGEREAPQRLGFLLKNIKRPTYIIDSILTEGACGFIAGEPKCYKSWVGLDMALSVATGAHFLGEFRVANPGPVLYIQEEDPPPTIKSRAAKIWVNKVTDKLELVKDSNEVLWLPPEKEEEFDPDVNAYIQKNVVISDEAWQLWLDETLEAGLDGIPYRLLIIDTLMMTAGDVEETRAQEMTTKIFKPLKTLARKHNVAIQVIHHMGKAEKSRPGQRMLGSVANHAWAEDSIYLSRSGLSDIRMDLESKTAPGGVHRIGNLANRHWAPEVLPWRKEDEPAPTEASTPASRDRKKAQVSRSNQADRLLLRTIAEGVEMSTSQIASAIDVSRSTAHKRLTKLLDQGHVTRKQLPNGSNSWSINEGGE